MTDDEKQRLIDGVFAVARLGGNPNTVCSPAVRREADILAEIKEALNRTDRVRLIRNTVGFDADRKIRYGLGNGSPDLIGPLRDGRVFGVECKAASGRLSPEQVAWWMAARKWGVTGGVARSVDEAMILLDKAEKQ